MFTSGLHRVGLPSVHHLENPHQRTLIPLHREPKPRPVPIPPSSRILGIIRPKVDPPSHRTRHRPEVLFRPRRPKHVAPFLSSDLPFSTISTVLIVYSTDPRHDGQMHVFATPCVRILRSAGMVPTRVRCVRRIFDGLFGVYLLAAYGVRTAQAR